MTSDAAIKISEAVLRTVLRLWAGPAAGAADGLTSVIAGRTQDAIERRRARRFFDECADTIAERMEVFLQGERQVSENERRAAVDAVTDTLQRAAISADLIVQTNLDAQQLERSLTGVSAQVLEAAALDEDAEAFYRRLLPETCAYVVEAVSTLPKFEKNVFAALLQRSASITEQLRDVLDRLPSATGVDEFTGRYLRAVARKFDRLEILGAALSEQSSRRYPLSVAYVSLAALDAWRWPAPPPPPPTVEAPAKAEPAPPSQRRKREPFLLEFAAWRRPRRAGSTGQPSLVNPFGRPIPGDDVERFYQKALEQVYESLRWRDDYPGSSLTGLRISEAVAGSPATGPRSAYLLVEPSPVGDQTTDVRVEDLLGRADRHLLVGEAGSGKTTLLHWLAVRAAQLDFAEPIAGWNGLIPFVIPLRRYAHGSLPGPEDFPAEAARNILDDMPKGWVFNILNAGQGLILIDGVDELPEERRTQARRWLEDLVEEFPSCRFVVTSRPAALDDGWMLADFQPSQLEPMKVREIRAFINRWHEAVRQMVRDKAELDRIDGDREALIGFIETDRFLRALCINPLLCALLCALNRDRNRVLPRNRMGVYQAALEMLLDLRDRARDVKGTVEMTYEQRVVVLQDLALFLVRNGWSDTTIERAVEQVKRSTKVLPPLYHEPPAVLADLIERSGLLRRPVVDRVDFIHRTFQEYLAGKAAVDADDIGYLAEHAEDDQFREVIVMASAHAQPRQRTELLAQMIRRVPRSAQPQRLKLLLLACMQAAPQLDPDQRTEIEAMAADLFPPRSMEEVPALAAVGEMVLDLLVQRPPKTTEQACISVRIASAVGGPDAIPIIAEIAGRFDGLSDELVRAWSNLEAVPFATEVMSRHGARLTSTATRRLNLPDPALVRHAHLLDWLEHLQVNDFDANNTPQPPALRSLTIESCGKGTLAEVIKWGGVTHLDINVGRSWLDPSPLAGLENLTALRIRYAGDLVVNLAFVGRLKKLRRLQLAQPAARFVKLGSLGDKSAGLQLYVPDRVAIQGGAAFRGRVIRTADFPPLFEDA
ncbi:NACHT domain-containing protein [Actinoplanes sp. CA-030573]|uniref:NACHT domain-containing protein n=1 Tax=Actinoplanes sp. CA-030573 TaxID=3239898 RepID=UPI003D903EE4